MFTIILAGFGIAIVLVEKKAQWPGSVITPFLKSKLSAVYSNLGEMLECTVCTSFWTTLMVGILSLILGTVFNIFLYAFAAIAVSWTIINFFNAIDPPLPDIPPENKTETKQ